MTEDVQDRISDEIQNERAGSARKAPRRSGQPMYTEARGRYWELWIKVSSAAKRKRVRSWIPIRRHAKTGAILNGDEAARALQILAALWECPQPRWPLLQRTVQTANPTALRDLHDALVAEGLAGADAMFAAFLQEDDVERGAVDLVPLVERWVSEPLPRERSGGLIAARTHRMMVSRVLKLVSPELLAWRAQCSLSHRDQRPLPARPNVPPFELRDYTWARIQTHLKATYRRAPTALEEAALKSAIPETRTLTEHRLAGQGAGAAAAFTAFRTFGRWLVHHGVLESEPTAGQRRPGEAKPKFIYLESNEDIECVAERLAAPIDDIWRLMCATGIEPSVALALTVGDVQSHQHPALFTNGTKTRDRTRQAECGVVAWRVVQRAYETAKTAGREKLFPDVDVRGRQLTRYLLSEQVRIAVASLVEEGHTRFDGVHAYTSRHTFAVMALLGGATYQEVAQQLGHVTTAMVIKRYGPHAPARGRIAAAIDAHVGQQTAANGNALNPNGGVADALGPE